jgi:hypothetical protein
MSAVYNTVHSVTLADYLRYYELCYMVTVSVLCCASQCTHAFRAVVCFAVPDYTYTCASMYTQCTHVINHYRW